MLCATASPLEGGVDSRIHAAVSGLLNGKSTVRGFRRFPRALSLAGMEKKEAESGRSPQRIRVCAAQYSYPMFEAFDMPDTHEELRSPLEHRNANPHWNLNNASGVRWAKALARPDWQRSGVTAEARWIELTSWPTTDTRPDETQDGKGLPGQKQDKLQGITSTMVDFWPLLLTRTSPLIN